MEFSIAVKSGEFAVLNLTIGSGRSLKSDTRELNHTRLGYEIFSVALVL